MSLRPRTLIIAVIVAAVLVFATGTPFSGATFRLRDVRDAAGRLTLRDMRLFPHRSVRHLRRSSAGVPRRGRQGGPGPQPAAGRPDQGPPTLGPQPTAAARYGWGIPVASDDFTTGRLDPRAWDVYQGPGQNHDGHRSPRAVGVRNGLLTITGRPDGTTGGLAWKHGAQRTGRWEARVRMNRACAAYHPVLLLWPTAAGGGDAPKGGGGEIDWLEVADDGTRQNADFYLHYGPVHEDDQLTGRVRVDMTRWHAFAVEWTARSISGFVDGERWFHTTRRRALPPGPMGQAIQLDWFPRDAEHTARGIDWNAPATFQVDWIRMYHP
ncbi:glycoside hydrolase family 16 protein [Actinomadura rupiterrae]|uniref:glycoside hydrolase family 16 protein n=1 Tax=Actinomadura rupiterrae TaxID=559627 RepID=UPI0020A2AA74|nr:glycoside hydrolase family 16 protein [Actinomadura rupiterrae]MCP2339728.1 licheninase [Actinomadura rupiterrae]